MYHNEFINEYNNNISERLLEYVYFIILFNVSDFKMKATLRLKFTLKFVYYNLLNFICF